MANTISIWIEIDGCESEVESVFQRMKSDHNMFDFKSLIPLPVNTRCDRNWCYNNWGSGSNSMYFERLTSNTVYFETANSYPGFIIKALALAYPKLRLKVEWIEESLESAGRWILCGENYSYLEEESYFCWKQKTSNCLIHLLNVKYQLDRYTEWLKDSDSDAEFADCCSYYLNLLELK
jgi:hypothetical protein